MNFFGGSGCGDVGRDCGYGNDCCSLIFLILLLNCCGGCGMKGINIDCGTILLLLLRSNCGCNNFWK
mgnify:FL=1